MEERRNECLKERDRRVKERNPDRIKIIKTKEQENSMRIKEKAQVERGRQTGDDRNKENKEELAK
jgi:hypothetical protein